MIDSFFRQPYEQWMVTPVVNKICSSNVHPRTITGFALLIGLCIPLFLIFEHPYLAFILLLFTGYLDTLDGSLARAKQHVTPTGAVFDIVSDRVVEFAVILGLFLVDPDNRGLICLYMLGSILICITSFLVVGIFVENQTEKSFYYSPGLIERTEAFIFFSFMILLPTFFTLLGYTFTALVLLTAMIRVWQFHKNTSRR